MARKLDLQRRFVRSPSLHCRGCELGRRLRLRSERVHMTSRCWWLLVLGRRRLPTLRSVLLLTKLLARMLLARMLLLSRLLVLSKVLLNRILRPLLMELS